MHQRGRQTPGWTATVGMDAWMYCTSNRLGDGVPYLTEPGGQHRSTTCIEFDATGRADNMFQTGQTCLGRSYDMLS